MELGDTKSSDHRSRGMIMHVNKVGHVKTIDRVAADLGVSVD